MGDSAKHLCKWGEKEYEKKLKKLRKIVSEPSFVCKRCGRAVSDKGYVCKPVALKEK